MGAVRKEETERAANMACVSDQVIFCSDKTRQTLFSNAKMDAAELVNLGLKEMKAPELSSVRINLEDLVVTFSPIYKQSLKHSL